MPSFYTLTDADRALLDAAIVQAEKSFSEQGLPIGAVLARGPDILAAGHNRRVQNGDPIAHGEMDCLRAAGRLGQLPRPDAVHDAEPLHDVRRHHTCSSAFPG